MADCGEGLSGRISSSTRPPMHFSPPPHLGFWKADVLSWEKQFFINECPVTWEQVSYVKRFMSTLYKNVEEWDDSAGAEALQNAKIRYWAKINNRRCNIPLPDPDMVYYNAVIDPEIVAAAYAESSQPASANDRNSASRNTGKGMYKNSGQHENSNKDAGRKSGCFGFMKATSSCWKNSEGDQNLTDQNEHTIYAGKPTSQQWKSA